MAIHGDHDQSSWLLVPLFYTENTDNDEISSNSLNQDSEFLAISYFSVSPYLVVEERYKRFRELTPVQVPCCPLRSSKRRSLEMKKLGDLGPPPYLQGDNRSCLL